MLTILLKCLPATLTLLATIFISLKTAESTSSHLWNIIIVAGYLITSQLMDPIHTHLFRNTNKEQ